MSKFEGMTLQQIEDLREDTTRQLALASSHRNRLDERLKPIQDERSRVVAEIKAHNVTLNEITAAVALRTRVRPEPTVTDHALLRYIERVHAVDIDALRRLILSETVCDAIQAGASAVRADGMILKISNNSVTTVITDDVRSKRPHRMTRAQRERLEDGGSHHVLDDEDLDQSRPAHGDFVASDLIRGI